MAAVVIQDLETGLRAVFRYAYEINCGLEDEEFTEEDGRALEELSPLETLENLKDLLEQLISCKRELKKTDKAELVDRCDQFEHMLQKLENDVRSHIRVTVRQVEQQLKLYAEAAQAKLDDFQRISIHRNSEFLTESSADRQSTEENVIKKGRITMDFLNKEDSSRETYVSHQRILSLEGKVQEAKGETGTRNLLALAEKKHSALLVLEAETVKSQATYAQKKTALEHAKADYERVVRELQLTRVHASKENLQKKPSHEKLPERSKPSPGRALTDRQLVLKHNIDRKTDVSPYKRVRQIRISSKGRLETLGEAGRSASQWRLGSSRSIVRCRNI